MTEKNRESNILDDKKAKKDYKLSTALKANIARRKQIKNNKKQERK